MQIETVQIENKCRAPMQKVYMQSDNICKETPFVEPSKSDTICLHNLKPYDKN